MKQCSKIFLTCAGVLGVIECFFFFFFPMTYIISIFLCKGSCPWYDTAYENTIVCKVTLGYQYNFGTFLIFCY